MDFLNSLRILKHVKIENQPWDSMVREKIVKQADLFINILPTVPKKNFDCENDPLIQFFNREYSAAYNIHAVVRNQLVSLKNYCKNEAEYTNEILAIRENILKGIFSYFILRYRSFMLEKLLQVSKVIFIE